MRFLKAVPKWEGTYFFVLFRAAPEAYGGSQARGQIGAAAVGLHHSHSDARSKPHLQPTPQLTARPDPLTHCVRPGSEASFSWILVRFVITEPQCELWNISFLKKIPLMLCFQATMDYAFFLMMHPKQRAGTHTHTKAVTLIHVHSKKWSFFSRVTMWKEKKNVSWVLTPFNRRYRPYNVSIIANIEK